MSSCLWMRTLTTDLGAALDSFERLVWSSQLTVLRVAFGQRSLCPSWARARFIRDSERHRDKGSLGFSCSELHSLVQPLPVLQSHTPTPQCLQFSPSPQNETDRMGSALHLFSPEEKSPHLQ